MSDGDAQEAAQENVEIDAQRSAEQQQFSQDGYLSSDFKILLNSPMPKFDTAFAKAFTVNNDEVPDSITLYALVFENQMPVRLEVMHRLYLSPCEKTARVLGYGKVIMPKNKEERFAVVIQQPPGMRISKFIERYGAMSESWLMSTGINLIHSAISELHERKIVHGNINPDTIFFDPGNNLITLGECVSDFCGYKQNPWFEGVTQLLCHPAGKGDNDPSVDYCAMGSLLSFMLFGRLPWENARLDHLLRVRIEYGSYLVLFEHLRASGNMSVNVRTEQLLRGLLADNSKERWQEDQVYKWVRRQEVAPPLHHAHGHASMTFEFSGEEFSNRRCLVHSLQQQWKEAQHELKIADVGRWMALGVKQQEAASALEGMAKNERVEVVLPDEKLARVLMMLDYDGPIRFKNVAVSITGIGTLLSYCLIKGEREYVQNIGNLLAGGLVDFWIRMQPDPQNYTYQALGWSPLNVRTYIRKSALGFGIERVVYEMTPSTPCLSPIVRGYYVDSLKALLVSLDKKAEVSIQDEDDPMDRHIGAYIAAQVKQKDDVRVKSLQNFPHVAKNPQVVVATFISLAQQAASVKSLPNLAVWINTRLESLREGLHSRNIRKDVTTQMEKAAKTGSVSAVFKVITNAGYIRRDVYGFREAKHQYARLMQKVRILQDAKNTRRLSITYGLRISVLMSYFVCIMTLLYVFLWAA